MMKLKYLFSECSLLSSLPDISKWNTNNLIKMKYLFNKSSLLKSLPDISNWNTNNLLSHCSLLKYLPYIYFKLKYK